MENMHDEEMEIDLREVYYALKKKLLWVLAAGILFGCLAGAYTKFFVTPTYTSTASVLAISKDTTLTSIADLQLGTQLTKDYQVLIKSTPVLEQVIENLELNMSAAALRGNISVANPEDTRILEISVVDSNPLRAQLIVDELAQVSAAYIGDKMEVIPPKVIEKGQFPTFKTAPSLKKNTILGALGGIFLAVGIIVVMVMMNDTIKTEEDVTKYLGLTTLASIPDRKDYIGGKKKKKKKKKKSSKGGRK